MFKMVRPPFFVFFVCFKKAVDKGVFVIVRMIDVKHYLRSLDIGRHTAQSTTITELSFDSKRLLVGSWSLVIFHSLLCIHFYFIFHLWCMLGGSVQLGVQTHSSSLASSIK